MPTKETARARIEELEEEVRNLRAQTRTPREPIEGFGGFVQSRREERRLGLREFATFCGISASTMSRVERMSSPDVDFETLKRLARGLRMETWEFVKAVESLVTKAKTK